MVVLDFQMLQNKPKLLVLTTSVFTDRMLQNVDFVKHISNTFEVEIWASSIKTNSTYWDNFNFNVRPFPAVKRLRHWSTYLRRINENAWIHGLPAYSILINQKYFSDETFVFRILKIIGKCFTGLKKQVFIENIIRKLILLIAPNENLAESLKRNTYDALLVMNPFWVQEPLVALEAKKIGISVFSLIPSWDNITTKSRIIYKSDAFLVWSKQRIIELNKYYPESKNIPVVTYGTPQYDVFLKSEYLVDKQLFFNKYQLDFDLPILLFTLGSPLFINSEIDVCLEFCKKSADNGLLDKFQVLIRPHPIKDFSEYIPYFTNLHKNIKIQSDVQTSKSQTIRFQDELMIKNWVSTFRYSDLVVATSSTTLLDASMMNKPHINIAANLTNDKALDDFLDDVSYGFVHLQSLNEEKLLNNVHNWEEFFRMIEVFVNDISNFPNHSKEIVFQLADSENKGEYGRIFSNAIIDAYDLLKHSFRE